MNSLCSGTGSSIADIYENLSSLGLTIGAAYKIVERLKDQGYIYPMRHVRVNEKGPMRELSLGKLQELLLRVHERREVPP